MMLLLHCPQAPQIRITFQVSFVVAASGGAVTSGDDMAGHASIQTNQRYIVNMRVSRVNTIVGVNLDSKSKER